MEKFSLQHIVLYAKGWYQRQEDEQGLIEDLQKCFTADDYSGEFFKKRDCASMLIHHLEKLPITPSRNTISAVLDGIDEKNCWKFGYVTKNNTWNSDNSKYPDYDQDIAIIKYCLSQFNFLSNKEWDVIKPDFEKVLPMKNGITEEQVEEIFN